MDHSNFVMEMRGCVGSSVNPSNPCSCESKFHDPWSTHIASLGPTGLVARYCPFVLRFSDLGPTQKQATNNVNGLKWAQASKISIASLCFFGTAVGPELEIGLLVLELKKKKNGDRVSCSSKKMGIALACWWGGRESYRSSSSLNVGEREMEEKEEAPTAFFFRAGDDRARAISC